MEEQNSIYLQRLCAAVKQVQIEASQTNEYLVRDGRTPLQLCGRYEDIFCHRYKMSTLSYLRKKTGFWGVVKEISRKEALTRIKNLQHPETDLGRCRAWIRLAANENSLVAYILSLQSNPEFLAKYYEPQAFLRDSDLTQAAINVLNGLDTIKFELTIDTSSLEVEIAPDAYVPADKLSRIMALELAHAIQQQQAPEPVLIERRPLRKKRRKHKLHSHSTDTDSTELPDSESDYGSVKKPPCSNPLAVGSVNKYEAALPYYSGSFEHSHASLFTDSGFNRGSPTSESKLSTSAPLSRAVFPKTFVLEKKDTPLNQSMEKIDEISEDTTGVANPSFDLLFPILVSPDVEETPTQDNTSVNEVDTLDIITPLIKVNITEEQKDNFDEIQDRKSNLKLNLDENNLENTDSKISEEIFSHESSEIILENEKVKSFKSLDSTPPPEVYKSPTIYRDFPSPFKPNPSSSLPIQTFLTADAVANQTSTRTETPNSVNSHSSSDDFYSINGEWDIIRVEDMRCLDMVSEEVLDSTPLFQSKFHDDYFMQEINVDKLTQNQIYSTMKKVKEELRNVEDNHPSHKILVHTLVKLRIRRLEMEEGNVQVKNQKGKCLRLFGHFIEINSGKHPPKICEICGKNFGPINISKNKWAKCRECSLTLHVACVKKIPSICPTQSGPKLILEISQEIGLLSQKFKCKNCSRQIGMGAKDEPRLCRYSGFYFCPNCYSITPIPLPAKIIHDWDFRPRGVSLSSYLTLKLLHSSPSIDLSLENPLLYSYENTLGECSTIRNKLKQMYLFLNVCQDAKQTGLLSVHQGVLHDHIWTDKEPWSIEDLYSVREGNFLPTLKEFFSKWDAHIRQCPRCSGNGHYCLECGLDDVMFPWDILAISCENCGMLSHSHCVSESGCTRCNMRARRTQNIRN